MLDLSPLRKLVEEHNPRRESTTGRPLAADQENQVRTHRAVIAKIGKDGHIAELGRSLGITEDSIALRNMNPDLVARHLLRQTHIGTSDMQNIMSGHPDKKG